MKKLIKYMVEVYVEATKEKTYYLLVELAGNPHGTKVKMIVKCEPFKIIEAIKEELGEDKARNYKQILDIVILS